MFERPQSFRSSVHVQIVVLLMLLASWPVRSQSILTPTEQASLSVLDSDPTPLPAPPSLETVDSDIDPDASPLPTAGVTVGSLQSSGRPNPPDVISPTPSSPTFGFAPPTVAQTVSSLQPGRSSNPPNVASPNPSLPTAQSTPPQTRLSTASTLQSGGSPNPPNIASPNPPPPTAQSTPPQTRLLTVSIIQSGGNPNPSLAASPNPLSPTPRTSGPPTPPAPIVSMSSINPTGKPLPAISESAGQPTGGRVVPQVSGASLNTILTASAAPNALSTTGPRSQVSGSEVVTASKIGLLPSTASNELPQFTGAARQHAVEPGHAALLGFAGFLLWL
jgi:hypothetical protein